MAYSIKDLALDPGVSTMLYANGVSDRQHGISKYDGWKEICATMGFSLNRSPARERYEDGWYSVVESKEK